MTLPEGFEPLTTNNMQALIFHSASAVQQPIVEALLLNNGEVVEMRQVLGYGLEEFNLVMFCIGVRAMKYRQAEND